MVNFRVKRCIFDGVGVGITDIRRGHYENRSRMITQSTFHDDRVVILRLQAEFLSKLEE